ncbi:ribosome-recycling factor, chloroplastic isoform X1 [Ananas comosus]|uniref:Ribosome-recycling factor, chloroplastic n=1 Tax=Ananas comosus TaxID=4615 RepID=A0A6P5F7X7_ANACO|nr:ribosome-recycling factor, chloroplastic isoform X1 [Ananas comosus]
MAFQSSSPAAARSRLSPSSFLLSQRAGKSRSGFLCLSPNVVCWSSTANYVLLQEGSTAFFLKPLDTRNRKKRPGFLRCATIEEIEAEKSLIERDVKERMEKTIETVRGSFNAVRTGRANPAMLDRIEVEYYGSPVSLKSIAQISTPDGSSLLVQPYDKSCLKAIEKAIVNSDIGLTPNNDGEVIRLSIPQLTSERRKELSKVVAKLAEEGKVAIRNIRRDAIKAYEKLEKEKKLSEDNVKDLSSDLQKVTDEYMKKIDSMQKQKEKVNIKRALLSPDIGAAYLHSDFSCHTFYHDNNFYGCHSCIF